MPTSIEYLKKMLNNSNIQAALMTIRKCEGTAVDGGYNFIFGSTAKNDLRFKGYGTHPRIYKEYTNLNGDKIRTSAAGAYQIILPTFEMLCNKYGFTDFTPETQDLMALALFDSENVLNAVAQGRFFEAPVLDRLNDQWASLPKAGYGQPEKPMKLVREYYIEAGGAYAPLA